MATQQEILQLIIQTSGSEDVNAAAKALFNLGQSSSEAAPQAPALLEQLAGLASNSDLVSGFVANKVALQELGDQMFAAKSRAAELQLQFDAPAAPSAALSRNLDKANASVASLESQYSRLEVALIAGGNALEAAGIDANNLDSAQRGLQASMAGVSAEATAMAASFNEASAAGEREALTLSEVAERSTALRAGFEQLKTLLLTFAGIFAFEKIKEDIGDVIATGDKFEKWGAQFKNAFGGAEQGAEALAKVKEIAEATPLSLDQVTTAALLAKKEGLDPFNGSLEAIIATSAKYGGGADTVNELITALGKAANQGGLSIRALTALQQQGSPAAQLLGDAIGKTADQVTQLAKNGKLGTDSVATLIAALGRHSSTGLADEMALVSTQVQKAKDNYDQFLELIAKSGAYDFVKTQLASVNAAFKEGLESGSLQESAKAIASGLVAIGNALITVSRFAIDHGTAIKEVVEDYVLFKAALLGGDLVGAAGRFVGLTAATKKAGAAAEAAATGGVGKLGTALGKIPQNVKIAVGLVGAEFAISETLKVVDTLTKITAQTNAARDSQNQYGVDQAALAQKAGVVAAQLQQYASVSLVTADTLAKKNRTQSEAYIAQLQSATRYYQALQIQAQASGDVAGAKAAGDALKALGIAADAAGAHLKDLNESLNHSSEAVGSIVERFDEFRTKGASAASAVSGAFDRIEINTPRGLQDAIDLIRQLSARGTEASAAIQSELVTALDKLDAADLSAFQENVSRKIAEATGNAKELKTALGAALQTELERLGLSAEQAGQKITTAGQSIIASFTDVSRNAQATGQQIQLAFASGLSKLTTGGEVDALKAQLQAAFDAGKIGAAQFTAGMDAAGRKAAELQIAAIEAGARLDGMGTQGTTAAQNISNALQDARDKLVVQANEMGRAIATALTHDGDAEALKAQLKGVEAQIAGLNKEIEKTGTVAPTSLGRVQKGTQGITELTNEASDALKKAADTAEKGYTEWGDSADAAALASQKITADTSHANAAMDALVSAIQAARAEFSAVSNDAVNFFDTTFKERFDHTFSDDGSGFDRVAKAIQAATEITTQKINDQRTALTNEIQVIDQLGTTANKSLGSFGTDATKAAAQMENLSKLIQTGNYDAGLLGQQDLAKLQQALDAAAQRARSLADAVKQAKDQVTSMEQQLQDDLDSASGNNTAVEDRRFQKQLDDLKAAAQLAGDLNTAEYQQAVANANALHQLKLKQIQQQQDAQNGTNSSGGGSTSNTSAKAGVSSGVAPTRFVQHSFATPKGRVNALVTENESDGFEEFIRQLEAQKVNSI